MEPTRLSVAAASSRSRVVTAALILVLATGPVLFVEMHDPALLPFLAEEMGQQPAFDVPISCLLGAWHLLLLGPAFALAAWADLQPDRDGRRRLAVLGASAAAAAIVMDIPLLVAAGVMVMWAGVLPSLNEDATTTRFRTLLVLVPTVAIAAADLLMEVLPEHLHHPPSTPLTIACTGLAAATALVALMRTDTVRGNGETWSLSAIVDGLFADPMARRGLGLALLVGVVISTETDSLSPILLGPTGYLFGGWLLVPALIIAAWVAFDGSVARLAQLALAGAGLLLAAEFIDQRFVDPEALFMPEPQPGPVVPLNGILVGIAHLAAIVLFVQLLDYLRLRRGVNDNAKLCILFLVALVFGHLVGEVAQYLFGGWFVTDGMFTMVGVVIHLDEHFGAAAALAAAALLHGWPLTERRLAAIRASLHRQEAGLPDRALAAMFD